MESSKIIGSTEESNSSESGWTTYIGSPLCGDDVEECRYKGANIDDGNHKNCNHADESDDSMASDASSGPSHQTWTLFKHSEAVVASNSFEKKTRKLVEIKEKAESRGKNKKDEMVIPGKKVTPSTRSGSKGPSIE
ncbi:hypothetical protein K2173_027373 [Erythroxylum novogranatense]|uniref:Uncharacterized protein n=1 Tax=Erythroxylum novogranatense TaxID=1862640 RepID=A0AAV8TYW7_9ROSI|nr:hypothetical protein K2173_027373 [Erythroxylum novogranatense]